MCNTQKFTPGPWWFRINENSQYTTLTSEKESIILLDDVYSGFAECGRKLVMDIDERNARLISQSPAMYNSLKELSEEIDSIMVGEFGSDWADYFGPLFEMIQKSKVILAKADGVA